MRTAEISRKTAETDIALRLNLDGTGRGEIATGCGFLDHMLTLFARHGRFDLTVHCQGDTFVDDHHTVEDVGICLGDAFAKARSEKHGRSIMLEAMAKDMEERFGGADQIRLFVAHTHNAPAAADFCRMVEETLGLPVTFCDPLSLSVACHIGPGALAIACSRKLDPSYF